MHSAKNTNVNHVNKKNIKKEKKSKVYLTVKQQRGRRPSALKATEQRIEQGRDNERKEESTNISRSC